MDNIKSRNLPFSKRGFNFETTMWAFTRFTVLAMYGLIIAGLLGGLIVSAQTRVNLGDVFYWAFFPKLTANPINVLWMTILAKLMVIAFILSACGHGVHGVLEILDDYFTSEGARRWSRNFIIAYAIVASLIAIFVIWTA